MKIIFLAKFKPDTSTAAADDAVRVAAESLAAGPFNSYEHGRGLKLAHGGGTHDADWGFIIDIDPADVETWRASDAHQAMGVALRPICNEGLSLEY